MSLPLDFTAGLPWTLAGHTLGAWSIVEPLRAPFEMPFPGVRTATTPIAWYDSVHFGMLEDAAWSGYRGSIARAVGETREPFTRHASAVVDLRSGDFGLDENALTIQKGDSLKWLRGEAMSGARGTALGADLSGHHAWGAAAAFRRKRFQADLTFAQRGSAAHLSGGRSRRCVGRVVRWGFVTSATRWWRG